MSLVTLVIGFHLGTLRKPAQRAVRIDLYEETAEGFGVGTKSSGIDAACEFSTQMLRNLERAADHPDMTEDLAAVLSTANVTIEHRAITGVEID